MANPPAAVKLALESICLLLGESTTDWKQIRSIIMRENFIPTIVNFSAEEIRWGCGPVPLAVHLTPTLSCVAEDPEVGSRPPPAAPQQAQGLSLLAALSPASLAHPQCYLGSRVGGGPGPMRHWCHEKAFACACLEVNSPPQ